MGKDEGKNVHDLWPVVTENCSAFPVTDRRNHTPL